MPLVTIDMKKGHSHEYKKLFLQSVHEGLMEALNIPDDDRFQRIHEIDEEYFETPDEKTNDFCIIEITMFPGRSKEQKKKVIEIVTSKLNSTLNIRPEDIFIIIHDPKIENWGMRGVQLGNS